MMHQPGSSTINTPVFPPIQDPRLHTRSAIGAMGIGGFSPFNSGTSTSQSSANSQTVPSQSGYNLQQPFSTSLGVPFPSRSNVSNAPDYAAYQSSGLRSSLNTINAGPSNSGYMHEITNLGTTTPTLMTSSSSASARALLKCVEETQLGLRETQREMRENHQAIITALNRPPPTIMDQNLVYLNESKSQIKAATKMTNHNAHQPSYNPLNFARVLRNLQNHPELIAAIGTDDTADTYRYARGVASDWHTQIRQNMSKKVFGQYTRTTAGFKKRLLPLPAFARYVFGGAGAVEKKRAAIMRRVRRLEFDSRSEISRDGFYEKVNAEIARIDALGDGKEAVYTEIVAEDERLYTATDHGNAQTQAEEDAADAAGA